MIGRRPYNGRSRREIRDQILAKQAYIKPENCPRGWSFHAVDFVNRLIQRKPYKRLGKQGIHELKQHEWFAGFDWDALKKKKMSPPFVPNIKNVFEYLRNLTEDFTELDTSLDNSMMIRRKSFQDLFEEYDALPRNDHTHHKKSQSGKVPDNKPEEGKDKEKEKEKKASQETVQVKEKKEPCRPTSSRLQILEKKYSVQKQSNRDRLKDKKATMEESKRGSIGSSKRVNNGLNQSVFKKSLCANTFQEKEDPKDSVVHQLASPGKRSNSRQRDSSKKALQRVGYSKAHSQIRKNKLESKESEAKTRKRSERSKKPEDNSKMKLNPKEIPKQGILRISKDKNFSKKIRRGSSQQKEKQELRQKRADRSRPNINRSLIRNGSKLRNIYRSGEGKLNNQSLNQKARSNQDVSQLKKLGQSKEMRMSRIKNDLRGYLSLNSKHFFEGKKIGRDKKSSQLSKKNSSKKLKFKAKNTRDLIASRGYYISPQYERKRYMNSTVLMKSMNYTRLNAMKQARNSSFSRKSSRLKGKISRDKIQESLCLGGEFGGKIDLQESLRKTSFNGTFFEKMKKFGRKKLQQARTNDRKKNISIYLSHNSNNFQRKGTNHKYLPDHFKCFNSGVMGWGKRKAPQLGLELTMVRSQDKKDMRGSLTNQNNRRLTKNSLRIRHKKGTLSSGNPGDIYKQLDDFERKKIKLDDSGRTRANTKGSKKKLFQRGKSNVMREIAEITQSLNCTSNFDRLALKVQNKENRQTPKKDEAKRSLDDYYKLGPEGSLSRKAKKNFRNRSKVLGEVSISNSRLNKAPNRV